MKPLLPWEPVGARACSDCRTGCGRLALAPAGPQIGDTGTGGNEGADQDNGDT